ncbi:MAG: hypothetical protein WKG00_08215 [Polyangiaceae bacterium]
MERTLACLGRYGAEIAAGASRIDVVGTSAMRDAQAARPSARARGGSSHPRVVSGEEEAALTYEARSRA